MLRIPYGTKYTVNVKGSVWKPAICDNCEGVYFYQIKHQATGSAKSVLWQNKQEAIDDANFIAEDNLENYLENEVRNYSCPDCGFYPSEVVQRKKNEDGAKALVLGLLVFAIVFASTLSSSWSLVYGLLSGVVVGFIFIRNSSSINPNSNAHTRVNQKFSEDYPVLRKSDLEYFLHSKKNTLPEIG